MLIPGIWEEWAFRGVIIPMNLKKYSKLTVLVISAVTFGLFHFINIIFGQDWVYTIFQVIFATSLGFLFAYIYIKTNNLLPSMIIHYLVNSLGQLFVNAIFYEELSAALFLLFGIGFVPATLGIAFVYLMTDFAFQRMYAE
jgi:membrane protease YdiL (CAAX protease family)